MFKLHSLHIHIMAFNCWSFNKSVIKIAINIIISIIFFTTSMWYKVTILKISPAGIFMVIS